MDELAKAARVYFDLVDANHPPQTKLEFYVACGFVRDAHAALREELERYEREHV